MNYCKDCKFYTTIEHPKYKAFKMCAKHNIAKPHYEEYCLPHSTGCKDWRVGDGKEKD